jgi:hypothetical protein
MIPELFYKEWLKLRWTVISLLTLFVAVLIYIALYVENILRLNEATGYWYNIIFRGTSYYGNLLYLPLLAGIAIAAMQFFPEIQRKRIKLTFHLPVDEYKALLNMTFFGAALLLALFIISFGGLIFIGSLFFPAQIIKSTAISITPWFLAGLSGYFLTAVVVLEPKWPRRIFFGVLAVGWLKLFLYSYFYEIYSRSLLTFAILILLQVTIILLPGHRFKKGVMQ